LPLDGCLYALQPSIPLLTRSALHRFLQRHGISRLQDIEGDKPKRQKFKRYPIGLPKELIDFHAGPASEPDWSPVDVEEWQHAIDEARALELGSGAGASDSPARTPPDCASDWRLWRLQGEGSSRRGLEGV
jgi:hypothetical protein